MQIKRKSKKSIIIAVITLVIIAGVVVYFVVVNLHKNSHSDGTSINYSPATSDQIESGNQIKQNSVNSNDPTKPNNTGSDQATSPVPQAGGKSKVTATLTAANQNGSTLQVRFGIGAVTSTGTCTLTLTKDSSVVTKTANVQALAGSTTCMGFDVPTSELSVGTWKIALHFENSDLTADTTGSTVVQQ